MAATIKEVMEFFGMTPTEFKAEWSALTTQDKMDFKNGIGDGSLTY